MDIVGKIDIAIMADPNSNWDESVGDHYTGLSITANEWEQLFLIGLGVPRWEPRLSNEETLKYYEHQKQTFKAFMIERDYPLLSRFWDIYEDVKYLSAEINDLLQECLKIQDEVHLESALIATKKMISSCHEALNINSGIVLLSD